MKRAAASVMREMFEAATPQHNRNCACLPICPRPAKSRGDSIEGEARDVGKVLGPWKCTWPSDRNVEYLPSLSIAAQGHPRIHALMDDTDDDGIGRSLEPSWGRTS